MVSTVTELPGACESGCGTSDMFGIVYGAVEWQRAGFREQWDDMAIVRVRTSSRSNGVCCRCLMHLYPVVIRWMQAFEEH
ncbi:hypothetical protein GQ600_12043 [Phytophthora cactorum]|nr:hypothetical protein GQ600_12043 [Phytophthora cactorum]